MRGGAPWFYDGLAGIEVADLLLVPRCAVRTLVRGMVPEAVDEAGLALTELRRAEM